MLCVQGGGGGGGGGRLKLPQNILVQHTIYKRINVDVIVLAVPQIEHIPVLQAARKLIYGQPSINPTMSILKYVTKQPSRKLKDHNLELPNADLPNLGVSSRACTTMPDAETQTKLPACTIMPHPDTSPTYAVMQRLGQGPVAVPVIYHQAAA